MKLSIITVNYNNREGLEKTIGSIVNQTWRDYEWIVIDGGSTDGSKELIEHYQDHFSYWCSEPDCGVYNAMNKGISKATGEYLNFMNSGDVFYDNNTLEIIFRESLLADVIYGDWIEIAHSGEILKNSPEKVTIDFFYTANICHQAMFVKAVELKKCGYDESFHVYADWARWMKMILEGASFQYVSLPVCKYDIRDGLSRRDIHQLQMELERVHSLVPLDLKNILDINAKYKNQLKEYQQNPFYRDIVSLYEERPLYRRLIHFSIIVMKIIRSLLNFFTLNKNHIL